MEDFWLDRSERGIFDSASRGRETPPLRQSPDSEMPASVTTDRLLASTVLTCSANLQVFDAESVMLNPSLLVTIHRESMHILIFMHNPALPLVEGGGFDVLQGFKRRRTPQAAGLPKACGCQGSSALVICLAAATCEAIRSPALACCCTIVYGLSPEVLRSLALLYPRHPRLHIVTSNLS